jgi:bacterioferritin-associated ferredoxin
MIVCSCNAFSDHQVRAAATRAAGQLRMSKIYGCLGFKARSGRCAYTIKQILDEMFMNWRAAPALRRDPCMRPIPLPGSPGIHSRDRPIQPACARPNACSIRSRPQ